MVCWSGTHNHLPLPPCPQVTEQEGSPRSTVPSHHAAIRRRLGAGSEGRWRLRARRLGGSQLRTGPAKGLFRQPEEVLDVGPPQKSLPAHVGIHAVQAGGGQPEPEREWAASAGQTVDPEAEQRALDDGKFVAPCAAADQDADDGREQRLIRRVLRSADLRPYLRRRDQRLAPAGSATSPASPSFSTESGSDQR